MYVTTFYSFKGGVGRTLALVNCAVELAKRGKRILLVDFDLEAPGISSFEPFRACSRSPGIVDYISKYTATNEAPDVRDYVVDCGGNLGVSGSLVVMPAGMQDSSYASRLAAIDWAHLYQEHHGFLMFEDLKAQWKNSIKPDYVFVDSRTGHTDVGGICTRQLPDAVVLLFFPNDQNIAGLMGVVQAIRDEKQASKRNIALHFVPSRVPDLDDEDGMLSEALKRARDLLGFRAPATTIKQYDSMDLLNQAIFSDKRPKSRLAREYRSLTDAIVRQNLEDRDGAIARLENLNRFLSATQGELPPESPVEWERTLDQAIACHPNDGEVLYRVALVRERLGNADSALFALNKAIEAGLQSPSVYLARASANRLNGRQEDAATDLFKVLESAATTEDETLRAVTWLCEIAPDRIAPGFEKLEAIGRLKDGALLVVIDSLLVTRKAASVVESMARHAVERATERDETAIAIKSALVLSQMASGRFAKAAKTLEESLASDDNPSLADLFNYAVACWGQTGQPDPKMFARAVAQFESEAASRISANNHQAMAMAFANVGEKGRAQDALSLAREVFLENPRREFSAWRYLQVGPAEFLEDLDAMKKWLRRGGIPAFLAEQSDSVSGLRRKATAKRAR